MTGRHADSTATAIGAMRRAGIEPDSFLSEYGPRQYEVTVAPAAPVVTVVPAFPVVTVVPVVAVGPVVWVVVMAVVVAVLLPVGIEYILKVWATGALVADDQALPVKSSNCERHPLAVVAVA